MTNKIEISRDLLALYLSGDGGDWVEAGHELRDLLAAPVVERQECCTPTHEEKQLLASGDYTPEELWGGSRPTCPKCISATPAVVDERAEFEAWYLGKFCGGQARLFRCVNADQIYYFAEVQSKWDAWQARACLDKVKELNQ